MTYVTLLRGINVGGKNKIAMADLRAAFEKAGRGPGYFLVCAAEDVQ